MGDQTFGGLTAGELQEVEDFHGHMCPGLALGVHAARLALNEIGPHAADEEVVAVTETDMCGVDAVQYLTGCTFGKGNLIHQDFGKNAFTFYRRSDGRAIRVVAIPDAMVSDEEHRDLFAKVRAGEATDAERRRFGELHRARSMEVLARPAEDFFTVERFMGVPPPRARIHQTIVCDECGEGAMATRIAEHDGRQLCRPCFERATSEPDEAVPARKGPNLLTD
ncbi:MAG: FmdE family protein [Acidimicrobiia bacterium]|nr:FmdE family protein [Acidimicrobiia bacterium]